MEVPLAGDSFERVLAAVLELDTGARDKILDRPGDENLACAGERCNTSADVNGDPAEFFSVSLALTGVEPRPDWDAVRLRNVDDPTSASDCPCRPVERCEEAVSCSVELDAPEVSELPTHCGSVRSKEIAPALVTKLDGAL